MTNININTQAAQYQTYLTGLQNLKAFYAPRVIEYLKQSPERQAIWRSKDPILDELLDIADQIERRTQT